MKRYQKFWLTSLITFLLGSSCCWITGLIIWLGGATFLFSIASLLDGVQIVFLILGFVFLVVGLWIYVKNRK